LTGATLSAEFTLDAVSNYPVPLAGLGTTERVERLDLLVEADNPVEIRLHRDRRAGDLSPVVLNIHGGGFVMGDCNMDDVLFEHLCPTLGVVGVSVNYRLSPDTPFPGALEDCFAAWQWIHASADAFAFDRRRVGVMGTSAGGGLAAALAQRVRDETDGGLAFQLLEAPMLDDRGLTPSSRMDGLAIWTREANEFAWKCYLGSFFGQRDLPPYASPARTTDLSKLPPTFIAVGGADGFRDEDIDYALRLSQAGVPTELHVYPGAPHGYQLFTDSTVALQGRRDADEWLARIIDTAL
jgi:acetyl esterase/lipase